MRITMLRAGKMPPKRLFFHKSMEQMRNFPDRDLPMFISLFQPINPEEDFVRERRCAFFILVLVLAMCLSAGCSFLPFSSSNNKELSKINAGFSSINSSPSHSTYSFDEVTGRLASLSLDFRKWYTNESNRNKPRNLYMRERLGRNRCCRQLDVCRPLWQPDLARNI